MNQMMDASFLFPALLLPSRPPGRCNRVPSRVQTPVPAFDAINGDITQHLGAAWAVVLRSYTGNDHVAYAVAAGPDVAVYSVHVTPATVVGSLFAPRECIPEGERPMVNTALWLGHPQAVPVPMSLGAPPSEQAARRFDIVVSLEHPPGGGRMLAIDHSPEHLSQEAAQAVVETLARTVAQMAAQPEAPVGSLDLCSETDLRRLHGWNSSVQWECHTKPVHEAILARCTAQPDSPAVCAWDGDLSYAELEAGSTVVARQLAQHHIQPDQFVAIYLAKSKWVAVAALGVLRAGGAFVLLDVGALPPARIRRICDAVQAAVVVCAPGDTGAARELRSGVAVLPVGSEVSTGEEDQRLLETPVVTPGRALYALFTSGSTGTPKGIVVEHGAFRSAVGPFAAAMGFTGATRALHYASHSFTVCSRELLAVLLTGGCLCIPSEADRVNDVAGFMTRTQVTFAALTPSVANVVDPAAVPTLRTLVLSGEPLAAAHIARWAGTGVRLCSAYGASEFVATAAVARDLLTAESDARSLGVACAARLWVVSRDDRAEHLLPVGALGQLVIESPGLARGYLHDEVRTRRQFRAQAVWQRRLTGNNPGNKHLVTRLYYTGDLCRYNQDGSIQFVGRQDHQVKINGQRVELGDVEHHLWAACAALPGEAPPIQQLAALAVPGVDGRTRLVAVLDRGRHPTFIDSGLECSQEECRPWVSVLESSLAATVPRYMVPTRFLFAHNLPRTPSDKLDRLRLQQWAATVLSRMEMETALGDDGLDPTDEERLLQRHWSDSLGVSGSTLRGGDNFFQRGGDSIAAMQLVAGLHRAGFVLTVAEIFAMPTLAAMATVLRALPESETMDGAQRRLAPFALLEGAIPDTIGTISDVLGLAANVIEDAYPATPMQEGLVALSIRTPGQYVASAAWTLPDTVDISRFQEAWKEVVRANPILRTRMVQLAQGLVQVVLHQDVEWEATERPVLGPPLEGPLVKLSLCGRDFHLVIHHALFDAWSLDLLCHQVDRAYHGETLQPRPFSPWIAHLRRQDLPEESFWRAEFQGLDATHFPEPPVRPRPETARVIVRHSMEIRAGSLPTDYTLGSVLRLAWAIVLSQQTRCEDVVFGATVIGRTAAFPDIAQLTGPLIATVPVRIQVRALEQTVRDTLSAVQAQAARLMPHEQTGLPAISRLGGEAAAACGFQNLLVIQPKGMQPAMRAGVFAQPWTRADGNLLSFANYPLTVICVPGDASIDVRAAVDPSQLRPDVASRMLHRFEHVYRQLVDTPEMSLADIDPLSPQDTLQLASWNRGDLPAPEGDICIHALIQERCQQQPTAPAVCDSDGALTYAELDRCSTLLATHLQSWSLHPGDYVLLLFDKSRWMTVAMLAVLKAGAAFVMADASYPLDRLRHICAETKVQGILSSGSQATVSQQLHPRVLVVDHQSMPTDSYSSDPLPTVTPVTPSDPAYVLYTSGSTGAPKGIVVPHRAVSANVQALLASLELHPAHRVLQFSAYAFDLGVSDSLFTLAAGACVCVPSDHDRRTDLARAARNLRATWLCTTPSVISLLDPADIPSLQVLVSGGEPLTTDLLDRWADRVRLINTYGPAECVVHSTVGHVVQRGSDPANIGFPRAAAAWIVHPGDHERLLPIGCVGELLLEGPNVSDRYINRPEETAAAFLPSPPVWLSRFGGSSHRLYKTGDLVEYASDGSLLFRGRKDHQIKLRGQRLEPGEVESQIIASSPEVTAVVVGLVRLQTADNRPLLVAFVSPLPSTDWGHAVPNPETALDAILIPSPNDAWSTLVTGLVTSLRSCLPPFMVPSAFIPLRALPQTLSGKTNRRLLVEAVATWSQERLAHYYPPADTQEAAADRVAITPRLQKLQGLVARVLHLELESVRLGLSFLALGGDSLTAMRLVTHARHEGLHIAVEDLFTPVALSNLVEVTTRRADNDDIRGLEHSPCAVEAGYQVLPTTWFQRFMLRVRACQHFAIPLPSHWDRTRLLGACQILVDRHSILRTVFTPGLEDQQVLQVVLPAMTATVIEPADLYPDLGAFVAENPAPTGPALVNGHPLFQVCIVRLQDSRTLLVLRLHHAQHDGLSFVAICEDLSAAYNGQTLGPTSTFADHLRAARDKPTDRAYHVWRQVLAGSQITNLPLHRLPLPPTPAVRSQPIRTTQHLPPVATPSTITLATLAKAAWAVTLSHLFSETADVVFAQVVHGRSVGIPHQDRVVGPCVNFAPVRVQVPSSKAQLLHQVHQQQLDTLPFQHLDLDEIIGRCTNWAADAEFPSFVRVQHFADGFHCVFDGSPALGAFHHVPLRSEVANLLVAPLPTGVMVSLATLSHILDQAQAEHVVRWFCAVLQDLSDQGTENVPSYEEIRVSTHPVTAVDDGLGQPEAPEKTF